MAGYLGASPVPQSIQRRQTFTATAGQTTFNTTGYTDGDFIDVYLNGVKLVGGTDYTASNGNDIVLATGASASDILDFVSFNSLSVANYTFEEGIKLQDPVPSDADNARSSSITFEGKKSGGQLSTLGSITAQHDDAFNNEKGKLLFKTNDGTDGTTPTESMRIDSDGSVQVIGHNTNNIQTTESHPLMVKSNSNHFGLSIEEYNGNETWQVGVDGDGDLNFHNSDSASPALKLTDDGYVGIGTNAYEIYPLAVQSTGRSLVYLRSTDSGSASGPSLILGRGSSSGADNDNIGEIIFSGAVPSGIGTANLTFAEIKTKMLDVTSFSHDGEMSFTVAAGGTVTEKLKIDADGVKIPSSSGIVFDDAGGSGTSSSNTLDSYEEGTWTPTAVQGFTGFSSLQSAKYTKIGELVHIQFYVGGLSGQSGVLMQIGGLPFTVQANGWSPSSMNYNGTSVNNPQARAKANESVIDFKKNGDDQFLGTDISGHLIFQVTYKTDS